MSRRNGKRLLVALLLLAAVAVALDALRPREGIVFLDVGQGDATLITAGGRTMLVDGGPDEAVLEGLAEALPPWKRSLDIVLVTHLDADHFAGLFKVFRKYRVGELWWTGVAPTTEKAREFIALVEASGVGQRFVRAGVRFDFGGGRAFEASWPREDSRGVLPPTPSSNRDGGGTNDLSVVGRFTCGEEEVLLVADISAKVETALVASGAAAGAAVLKVAHHGSAHSSSESFLDAVHPREAVISSGAHNRYGHPAPRVLESLAARGIRVRRTDREGSIHYACDGGRLVPRT
jgi:competence protein ComEC